MVWGNKRVLITGGAGFLGSHLVDCLRAWGCRAISAPRSTEYDLRQMPDTERLLNETRPHIIFHAAAVVGGIGANQIHPGDFFYENLSMGMNVMEQARRQGVEKLVAIGTVCAYPKFTPIPFREEDLWNGYPEETNAPYGLAKKMLLVQAQAYRKQYGFNAIYVMPTNLYGPRDHFDLTASHVIPALIRKCVEARTQGAAEIVLWGDGSPTRDFLYVEEAAEGLIQAAERYDGAEPVNLGSGREVSIRDLADLIARLTGFSGRITWDTSRPNGQPRRCLDTRRAAAYFGFTSKLDLEEGLRRTITWYEQERQTQAQP